MTKDQKHILEFVKNLSVKNYNNAERALKLAVEEKIKQRIKNSLSAK